MNTQSANNNTLVTENGITKLSNSFVNCSSFDLAVKCLTLSVFEGVENVEKYIKNTFFKQEATTLISMMNVILKLQYAA